MRNEKIATTSTTKKFNFRNAAINIAGKSAAGYETVYKLYTKVKER